MMRNRKLTNLLLRMITLTSVIFVFRQVYTSATIRHFLHNDEHVKRNLRPYYFSDDLSDSRQIGVIFQDESESEADLVLPHGKRQELLKQDRFGKFRKVGSLEGDEVTDTGGTSQTENTETSFQLRGSQAAEDALTEDIVYEPVKKLTEEEFIKMLHEQQDGTTRVPVDLGRYSICISDDNCMVFEEYRQFQINHFIKGIANPVKKSAIPPTLLPYTDDIVRPNPESMIKDRTMTIDDAFIDREIQADKARRMKLGDDDLLQIPEVKAVLMRKSKYKIPNIVHFIWFSCHVYRVHHYTSMLGAFRYQKPSLILFHTNCPPNGTYWNAFQNVAGKRLRIVQRSPPIQIFGHNFEHVEHQSDIARLQILLEIGGIYLDDDVIILKSLDELRSQEMVLGEENYDALANSLIMANKDSWFLRRWFQEYQYFNGTRWSDSSCFVPWSMWRLFPSSVMVVKEKMLRPNWEEVSYIYHELWDWRQSYSIHLYSRFMKLVDGRVERSIKELAVLNTTYGEISRHVIWGDSNFQDISDWLF